MHWGQAEHSPLQCLSCRNLTCGKKATVTSDNTSTQVTWARRHPLFSLWPRQGILTALETGTEASFFCTEDWILLQILFYGCANGREELSMQPQLDVFSLMMDTGRLAGFGLGWMFHRQGCVTFYNPLRLMTEVVTSCHSITGNRQDLKFPHVLECLAIVHFKF